MHKIYIGNEEIDINEDAYSYLVEIISNYPFINKIEFVLDDMFISPDTEETILSDILGIIYLALKFYGDSLLRNKSDELSNLWNASTIDDNIHNSKIIKNSYKQIIKLDRLCNSLNDLMGYTR